MKNPSASLMYRFLGLYLGVSLFGMGVITLNNLVIWGQTWGQLLTYNLWAMSVQVLCLVLLFQSMTIVRLRKVCLFLRGEKGEDATGIWHTLLRFPYEMFWGMVLFGLFASPLYHGVRVWMKGGSLVEAWGWRFLDHFLFEQTVCLMLAILFFSLIRRLLRPYILLIPEEHMKGFRRSTVLRPLLLSFISLHLISVLSLIRYVLKAELKGRPMDPSILFSIGGFTTLFGIVLFYLLVREFRREFQLMLGGLQSLLKGDRSALQERMPILSRDEIGQLGEAFNGFQARTFQEYESLEEELKLACNVQQQLLPKADHELGSCRISALFRPSKEVGGDLFDIIKITDDRLAVLIGDVSGKGLPAALIMSATLALFRSEVRHGGTAGDIMTRLNRLLLETVTRDLYVTVGIAMIDQRKGLLEYASAGHMNPYLIRKGRPLPLEVSSLPLGILHDETYQEITLSLDPGDRILFFTDGVVESFVSPNKMIGFTGLEQFLEKLDGSLPVKDQVAWLVKQIPQGSGTDYDDDLTMVMVHWNPASNNQMAV